MGVDKMSSILDYSDRTTCIIFGDGAGAVLLEKNDEGNGIMDSLLKSDGSGRKHLHMKAGGSVKPCLYRNCSCQGTLFIPGRAGSFQICCKRYG